jgi:hypothetical protein
MSSQKYKPTKEDFEGQFAEVQNFAFGGIANPTQRAVLRGSDKAYLDERQKELDAFEAQRQAYNTSLEDWQTNVYAPYASQVGAYNAAAEKYNTDVYNPYKSQAEAYNTAAQTYTTDVYNPYKEKYGAYTKAIEDYNAGPRTTDYAGPAEPQLASTFTMAAPKEVEAFSMPAPVTPKGFEGTAPAVPFKEADVLAYQQAAAERARADAGNRAVAIDVVSNPDQFNFGSMSISNRFMAEGGLAEVNEDTLSDSEEEADATGSARAMLANLSPSQEESPTGKSIKRPSKKMPRASGGTGSAKEMAMAYDPLTSAKDLVPQTKDKGSARSQMEALARAYKLRAQQASEKSRGLMTSTMGAPTLEQPTLTKNVLTAKRFEKGGEAKKSDVKKPESSGFFSNLFKGSDDDFIKDIKNKAEQNEDYRGLLQYLQSRDAVPDVKTGNLPYGVDAVFNTIKLPIGSGTIKINKDIVGSDYKGDIGPSTLTHEMTHATDRQLEQQAGEQSGLFSKGNKFTDAYTKMVGPGGMRSGEKRTELARKIRPKWAAENKDYRATPYEIAAHGVGNYAGPTTADNAPPHIDATAATEFQILLDLARRNSGAAVKRAEGTPVEGEESLDKYYAPKARPSTGLNRKEGPISQALKSGEAYTSMAKGVTELPYDIAGAPVDLATMLLRPFGYSTEKPVMGSDFIKEKMTKLGVRPEPPADPTAKGFYTAGELLSNLTNPAGVTRSAVKGAKKTGEAATAVAKDFQDYNRQLAVPGASYAVRPTGSTMLTGPVGLNKDVSEVDKLLQSGVSNAKSVAGQNEGQQNLLADFWDKKARNYFSRQFGTPDDPIAAALSKKQIKGQSLEELFPEYMLDQIAAGKTRVNEQGQERFFPKYPRAMEDFTSRYDKATGLKGNLITSNPGAAYPDYNLLSEEGRAMGRAAAESEADKMLGQGLRPELINTDVGVTTRSAKDPERILGDSGSAKDLYEAFEESSAYNKLTPEQKTEWANTEFGKGRRLQGLDEEGIGKNLLGENVRTAIEKGEPVYDIGYMGRPLKNLFKPENINTYLATLSPREVANIRFEDAVRGGLKLGEQKIRMENITERIKSGKPVADSVFAEGVSKPLLQFGKDSGLDGFAWKRIEKREATLPEGAYVGHSVGGYETGGVGYTSDKREGFNTGKWQVYTLRDNRNRPVNTIEVRMADENTPIVTQIKGNGRSTGNVPAEKYDGAVLRFFQDYLKPAAIEERDSLLTPLLQNYKAELGPSPRLR